MRNVCVRCICKQTTRLHYKYIAVLISKTDELAKMMIHKLL